MYGHRLAKTWPRSDSGLIIRTDAVPHHERAGGGGASSCDSSAANRRRSKVGEVRDAGGSCMHSRLPCRQPPDSLAPVSVTKCPHQESRLIIDLRRVACGFGTLREQVKRAAPRNIRQSCNLHTRRSGESNAIRAKPSRHDVYMFTQEPTTGLAPAYFTP